jgi:hypothetical protein
MEAVLADEVGGRDGPNCRLAREAERREQRRLRVAELRFC